MSFDIGTIKPKLDASGQSHLYAYWDELSDAEKSSYFTELDCRNIDRSIGAYEVSDSYQSIDGRLVCPDPCICGHADSLCKSYTDVYNQYCNTGLTAISENKVAVILLSGGQGTRLGCSKPKGMYNIGLPSGRSLFQLQAERLLNLCKQTSVRFGHTIFIPWYIMTSDSTQEATETFFREHNYFGYSQQHVVFFDQLNMPAFNFQGKILMKTKGSLCLSPEGNGGLYRALADRGVLENMLDRGVEYVHIYGVDNVLIRMADPAFTGFCIVKSAECAVKVVEKVEPTEPIGVVGVVDGKFQVVEYSEMAPSTAALVLPIPPCRLEHCPENSRPRLLYSLGNICNHFMTLDFLQRVCHPDTEVLLPYHVARKKVAHLDPATGEPMAVRPASPNALKLEKFVFDVFRFAQRFSIWEVDRAVEFSPLKNGPGSAKDSPETCRSALLTVHASWARAAGATFASDDVNVDCLEISPLISLNGENLDSLNGATIKGAWRMELELNESGHEEPMLFPAEL